MKYIFKYVLLFFIIVIGYPVITLKHLLYNFCNVIYHCNLSCLVPYSKELYYIPGLDYKLIDGKWYDNYYVTIEDYLNEKETWLEDLE